MGHWGDTFVCTESVLLRVNDQHRPTEVFFAGSNSSSRMSRNSTTTRSTSQQMKLKPNRVKETLDSLAFARRSAGGN
jgi:hypothetical protein